MTDQARPPLPAVSEMVDDAYGRGQPFMDRLVAELLTRGANTPEQNERALREGLLRESYENVMYTWSEREAIWRRYRQPLVKRLTYRIEAWRTLRRLKHGRYERA